MGVRKLVEVTVEIKHHTDKAVLVSDGETECWIPFSLVEELKDILEDTTGLKVGIEDELAELETITIPEWLAIQHGLI